MKRFILVAAGIPLLLILLAAAGCDGVTSPPVRTNISSSGSGQNTGIWVSGTGEVSVTPDIAVLQVGVQAKEETVLEAQEQASEAMEKVLQALTGSGVKDEDIQTQYFRIRQDTRWDSFNDEEEITGYEVTNTVTAKLRDIENVGNVINAAVIAGGDLVRINNLSFTVEKPEVYYDEARELATANAKTKAEKLAEQTGVKLGTPTFISESTTTPSQYGGINYGLSSSAPVPAPVVIVETPTSPGQVEVTLTVQIAYSIK